MITTLAERYARQIEVLLSKRHFLRARTVLEEAIGEIMDQDSGDAMTWNVDKLGLSFREESVLSDIGISKIAEVVAMSRQELISLESVGKLMVKRIERQLMFMGLKLKE